MSNTRLTYRRIVSLTASLTETLFAVGAADRVAGVTDTCDFPIAAKEKPNVGCWFDPDVEKLLTLAPDLVLGLSTAHQSLAPKLKKAGIPLNLVNPSTLEEALATIECLGEMLQVKRRTRECVKELNRRLERLDCRVDAVQPKDRRTVSRVLDIADDQFIVAGPHSFQYDVISRAGGLNVTSGIEHAYPKVSFDQFSQWDPEVIFFCGYDQRFIQRFRSDKRRQNLRAVRTGCVYQFDCALTCRTGPRIVDMAELLFETLYMPRNQPPQTRSDDPHTV